MDHSVVGLETASGVFASAFNAGSTPLVRVSGAGAGWILRSLDGGVLGVIVSHVNTAAGARAVVEYAKFSPLGERSIIGGIPIFHLKSVPNVASSLVANEATLVIYIIETEGGVNTVDEILAVEGVDMIHVGTNDLVDSLGIKGDLGKEIILETYARITDAAARASVNGRKVYLLKAGNRTFLVYKM
jgi:4-hydroxy-2-oxoheptanedioate aldolase